MKNSEKNENLFYGISKRIWLLAISIAFVFV